MNGGIPHASKNQVSVVFVTGTGTDVGKTVVCAAISRGLASLGVPVTYWKPVQSGDPADATAVAEHGQATLHPTRFAYKTPASPDQAARMENAAAPTVAELVAATRQAREQASGVLIIEGAGGLAVPFNEQAETWLDYLGETNLPTLVVGGTGLGTLNHTTLTVDRLNQEGQDVLGLVLTGPRHGDNELSISRLLPGHPWTWFPQVENLSEDPEWLEHCEALATTVQRWEQQFRRRESAGRWLEDDKNHVWHPYTQHKTAPSPLAVTRAHGIWLDTTDGQTLLDGNSSWWVNMLGHGRREIAEAIGRQQRRLDHVIFAGATHEPGAKLARKLSDWTDGRYPRTFYSDNGSTAVEVGLKMAYQSWTNRGEFHRTKFLAFQGSYHGDTFGTMAVAASEGFHGVYRPLLFETAWADPVTAHPSRFCPNGETDAEDRFAAIETLLAKQHTEFAGVVIEPLIQGAGGMLVQPSSFLKRLESLCRKYELPLIFDEVFTGLGRIGAPFAFQKAGVEPDIVCVAKGLTGGNLPIAATLARESFFEAFLHDDKAKALLHGHSYTGNAICSAASLACLQFYENHGMSARCRDHEERFNQWVSREGAELGIENPRVLGGILAFELPGSGHGDYFDPRAKLIPEASARYGLFLRPLGNTVYFMPPPVIDDRERENALDGLTQTIRDITGNS